MPDLKKPKYKKLVFDYADYENLPPYTLRLPVHKAILARLNKLLEMFSKRVVQYRFSVRVDINRIVLEITEPIAVHISWEICATGDFELTLMVRGFISDHVHIQSLHDDVVYVNSKIVRGSDRYQAKAFAAALSNMLADIAGLEREHSMRVQAVTQKLTTNNPARLYALTQSTKESHV